MTLEEYISLRKLMAQMRKQDQHLEAIRKRVEKNTWLSDFSSNVAGNAAWDGLLWIIKLLKR